MRQRSPILVASFVMICPSICFFTESRLTRPKPVSYATSTRLSRTFPSRLTDTVWTIALIVANPLPSRAFHRPRRSMTPLQVMVAATGGAAEFLVDGHQHARPFYVCNDEVSDSDSGVAEILLLES